MSFFQQVYFHQIGTPVAQDRYEVGKEFPRIAEIELSASPDGKRFLATVANGDGGEFAHYLREPSGQWRQVTRFSDGVVRAEFGRDPLYIEAGKDDALYLLSKSGRAERKDSAAAVRANGSDEGGADSSGNDECDSRVSSGGERVGTGLFGWRSVGLCLPGF